MIFVGCHPLGVNNIRTNILEASPAPLSKLGPRSVLGAPQHILFNAVLDSPSAKISAQNYVLMSKGMTSLKNSLFEKHPDFEASMKANSHVRALCLAVIEREWGEAREEDAVERQAALNALLRVPRPEPTPAWLRWAAGASAVGALACFVMLRRDMRTKH